MVAIVITKNNHQLVIQTIKENILLHFAWNIGLYGSALLNRVAYTCGMRYCSRIFAI